MTFEQMYAPILSAVEEQQAKKSFDNLVNTTLIRSCWENTPNNRERAEELMREEIEFLAQYEKPRRAAMLYQFYLAGYQMPNALESTELETERKGGSDRSALL